MRNRSRNDGLKSVGDWLLQYGYRGKEFDRMAELMLRRLEESPRLATKTEEVVDVAGNVIRVRFFWLSREDFKKLRELVSYSARLGAERRRFPRSPQENGKGGRA